MKRWGLRCCFCEFCLITGRSTCINILQNNDASRGRKIFEKVGDFFLSFRLIRGLFYYIYIITITVLVNHHLVPNATSQAIQFQVNGLCDDESGLRYDRQKILAAGKSSLIDMYLFSSVTRLCTPDINIFHEQKPAEPPFWSWYVGRSRCQ